MSAQKPILKADSKEVSLSTKGVSNMMMQMGGGMMDGMMGMGWIWSIVGILVILLLAILIIKQLKR